MKYISHRGNIDGKSIYLENTQEYIDTAISVGFNVEVDVWIIDSELYLGHDKPSQQVQFDWLFYRKEKLWIHCKNLEAFLFFKNKTWELNYFWHQNDDFALTSQGYLWTYPNKPLSEYSIAVMPEMHNDVMVWDNKIGIQNCAGICSDFIENIRKNYHI